MSMGFSLKSVGRQLFNFFSSLQLAVALLLSLAIILSVGTFYESVYDSVAAKHYVYGTWWFYLVLVLLGTNVLCAALSRYPWKRHHSGFVVVHLGIILILIGSLITLMKGYEGQLIIPEGQMRDRIILNEPGLYFYNTADSSLEEMPASFRFKPPTKESPYGAKLFDDVLVKIDDYLPSARVVTEIREGEGMENPAIKVIVEGSRANIEEWAFSRDYTRSRLHLGPASLTFLELPDAGDLIKIIRQDNLRGPVLWVDGKLIPFRGNLGRDIPLNGKTLFLENFLPHGAVNQGQLANLSDRPENPVAKLSLRGKEGEEKHTVFARFPHLPTFHQKVLPTETRLKLLFIPEDLNSQKNEMILVRDDKGKLYYALKSKGEWTSVLKVPENASIQTGWMDFQLKVSEHLKRAQIIKKYRRAIVPKGQTGPPPAIHMAVANSAGVREFWLGRGESKDVNLGDKKLKIAYALKTMPLGFQVQLDDFRIGHYEGTNNPSSYESQVTLIDPLRGIRESHLIAMNEPLTYKRFKTFQSSYQLNPDGPDWSVFAVAYDPGILIKYTGSIILVLGIILIFFFRPAFLKKNEKKPSSHQVKVKENKPRGQPLLIGMFLLLSFLFASPAVRAQSPNPVPEPKQGINLEVLRNIPVLNDGRQKPLDSFARETVRFVTGRENFRGFDPMELILSWLVQTDQWEKVPLLQISYRPIAGYLEIDMEKGRVSPDQLKGNQKFSLFIQSIATKQQEGADLTELEKEGGLLQERLNRFYKIADGSSLYLLAGSGSGWENLRQLSQKYPKISFKDVSPEAKIAAGIQGLLTSYYQNDGMHFEKISEVTKGLLRERGQSVQNYPALQTLNREVHYNKLKPFRWAWVGYALAFFIILLSFGVSGKWLYRAGLFLLLLSFGLHVYGFILRIIISGRPPVTNMYETVIWVPFGAVLFGLVLESIYKVRYYALAAAGIAALGLILADNAPNILDPAISPLVPVLRNNFWLTVHVLTITLSYGAFTLAMGVGNITLGHFVFKPQAKERIERLNYFTYRALQVGVVLLAAGTILGGVWANASWGRFWGWDPKEVWALIALLGYLAILHGRYAGWIKSFGLAAGSVMAYLLVLMAWYGVNFILGAGLHAYGFSSGGAVTVSIFTGFELFWVGLAALRYKLFNKYSSIEPSSV